MDRDNLELVARSYFKDKIGAEPDTLKWVFEDDYVREYSFDATLGTRLFEIWLNAGCNLVSLNEKHHTGIFSDVAALAGLDRNLNALKEA